MGAQVRKHTQTEREARELTARAVRLKPAHAERGALLEDFTEGVRALDAEDDGFE